MTVSNQQKKFLARRSFRTVIAEATAVVQNLVAMICLAVSVINKAFLPLLQRIETSAHLACLRARLTKATVPGRLAHTTYAYTTSPSLKRQPHISQGVGEFDRNV